MCSPPHAAFFTVCDTACDAISEEGRRADFSLGELKHRRGRFPAPPITVGLIYHTVATARLCSYIWASNCPKPWAVTAWPKIRIVTYIFLFA